MASPFVSTIPVLLRPRNFQWYWSSAFGPWSGEEEEWQIYTDVENEIIEDAYNAGQAQVEIDGDYVIDLEFLLQYNKLDGSNARQTKRVQLDRDCRSAHPREERFSLPITLATPISSTQEPEIEDTLEYLRKYGDFPDAYYDLEVYNKGKTFADIIDQAAKGILEEGTFLGEKHVAQWLSKQLSAVRHFGINVIANRINLPPEEVGKACVHIYTRGTFWYKLLNRVLRDTATITREQIKTLGPFCYLLELYLLTFSTNNILTVYRGLDLSDEQRQEFMKEELIFKSFTSTSKSRDVAEAFSGNTLLVIDLNVKHPELDGNIRHGADISSLSQFPVEEEFLIWPSTEFNFVKCEYDTVNNKHIIYLKTADEKWND